MAQPGSEENMQKALLFQMLQKRMEELRLQASSVEQAYAETDASSSGLASLSVARKDDEVIVSIGSGMFAKVKAAANETVLVVVGAGIVVEKTMEEARKFLDERKKELEQAGQTLSQEAGNVNEAMGSVLGEMKQG